MLEDVKGELCLLEEMVEMRYMLRCMLEAVDGALCLREVSEVPEVPEVMRCVLLCILEAVDGKICLLGLLEVSKVMEVSEVLEALAGGLRHRDVGAFWITIRYQICQRL